MSAKFLLPCSCGAKIAIDVGKAGRMVRCRCGRKTEVPTMREIKKLQPLQERTIDSAGEWNLRRAIAFAGALATLVALLSAGSLWLSSPLSPQQNGKLAIRRRLEKMVDQSFVRQRQIEENMAKKTTIEVYQEWQKQRQKDVYNRKIGQKTPPKGWISLRQWITLNVMQQPQYKEQMDAYRQHTNFCYVALIAAIVGAVISGTAISMGRTGANSDAVGGSRRKQSNSQ